MGGLFSSGGTKTEYAQSPEQRSIYRYMKPFAQGLMRFGTRNMGFPTSGVPITNLGQPQAPYMPSMAGVISDIPTDMLMPSSGWYQSLSPQVMAGIWEPYNEGARQMMEIMGGSQRAGLSGATGAALGKYYEDAATQVGQQAWGMTQPAYQAQYGGLLQERMSDYQQEIARQQADYQTAMQAWGMPYSALGMLGGTYSTPVVQQQPGLLDILGTLGPLGIMGGLLFK